MKRNIFILLLSVCFYPASSQAFFDIAISKEWKGEGTLFNSKAKFHMKWDNVLNGQFYRLEFENEQITDKVNAPFQAVAYYKLADSTSIEGFWFDTRGVSFPLQGSITKNQLIVNWGTSEVEMGKSVYTLIDDGKISVVDYINRDGKSVEFGRATYQ